MCQSKSKSGCEWNVTISNINMVIAFLGIQVNITPLERILQNLVNDKSGLVKVMDWNPLL